jgi:hypothetical protein
MKDNSFAYKNEAITFFNGYLDINNYSIKDLFPTDLYICTLCVVQLESAYVFRELCRQAAIIWRNKYSTSQTIKFEHVDEVDNDSQNDISPALVDNVKNEQGENDEYLSNCGSTKATENDAENHEEPTHSNDAKKIDNNHQTAKKYSCTECKKTYSFQRALLKHKNNEHPKDQDATKFSCAHCVKKYRVKSSLRKHINIVHLKTRYSCKVCSSVYRKCTFRSFT